MKYLKSLNPMGLAFFFVHFFLEYMRASAMQSEWTIQLYTRTSNSSIIFELFIAFKITFFLFHFYHVKNSMRIRFLIEFFLLTKFSFSFHTQKYETY